MPELPEVETVARDLRAVLVGRRVGAVRVDHPGVVRHPSAEAFAAGLNGAMVRAVERRGKYIVCPLDTEEDLVIHLGMTGHLRVCDAADPPAPHLHIRAALDDGRELRYDDVRRFGRVLLGTPAQLRTARALPELGMEPLSEEFTRERFEALLRRTTRPVKAALLDQRGVAGLGNIYIDEICHLAGVRPQRRCHTLMRRQRTALFDAVPVVLAKAIRNRGSSVDDYRDLWDAQGSHQEELQAYGRAGLPCLRCGRVMRRTVVAGRGTTYCSGCQR